MVGGFAVLSMVTAAVSSWLVESVTAATNERKKADELTGADELARLTAQINRLHDQLAQRPGGIDNSPAEDNPRKEPDSQQGGS
jgi:voltage-gated potassium channel